MNNAPRFATMLSILRSSLNKFGKCAAVRPYTELITIFNALANLLRTSLEAFANLAKAPPNNVLSASTSRCLIAIRASTRSLNLAVYFLPKRLSAMMVCGCMDATSKVLTFVYIPGSAITQPPSPTSIPL